MPMAGWCIFFLKLTQRIHPPCVGAFAIWGSVPEIHLGPKVVYEQADLGHDPTCSCIDQNPCAIFSVSWEKVSTDTSDNSLNWPCKIMMSCMMTGRLFFQRCFFTFRDVLWFASSHFLIQDRFNIQQVLFPNSITGNSLFKGGHIPINHIFWDSLHHVSHCIVSVQDTFCYCSDFPQVLEDSQALHTSYCLN